MPTHHPLASAELQFVFIGPTPLDVMEQFTRVVGRPAMQPWWAFGFHQSRQARGGMGEKGLGLGQAGGRCVYGRVVVVVVLVVIGGFGACGWGRRVGVQGRAGGAGVRGEERGRAAVKPSLAGLRCC